MWGKILSSALVGLVVLTCSVGASAAQEGFSVREPEGGKLKGGALYLVEYKCSPLSQQEPKARSLESFFSSLNIVSQTTETFGFYMYKGAAPVADAPAGFQVAAGNILSVEHVYTRDAARTSSVFWNTSCQGQFIINGADTPNVMAYLASSKKNDTKFWAGIATLVTSSMGPLTSLLSPGQMVPGTVTAAAANGSKLLDNYLAFLQILDNTRSASRVIPLRTGHLHLATSSAAVEMDITEVTSLLLSDRVPFRDSLKKILATEVQVPSEILKDDAKLVDKCNSIANAWIGAGLISPTDLAYVMVQQLLPSSPNKHHIVQCLGAERAQAALDHLHLFRIVKELRYTQADIPPDATVNSRYGQQPQGWTLLGATTISLIKQATRFGGNIALASSDADSLGDLFAEEVTIRDETTSYDMRRWIDPGAGDNVWTGTASDMLTKLANGGVRKWGCYVETDKSAEFRTPHHDAVVLLAFVENKESYDPFVTHVLFDSEQRIVELAFSDDLDPQLLVSSSQCNVPTPPAAVALASSTSG